MSRFDRLMLAVVLALGLTAAALSVAAARVGPSVDSVATAQTLDGTSVNTEIGLAFTEPMDPRSVENHFHISPHISGDFSWTGNELLYIPRRPLAYGTAYHVTVTAGAASASGKQLTHVFQTTFYTQVQHLLFLGTWGRYRGRMVLVSIDGRREIVGNGDGLITGYSVSPNRSLAVYVKRGSPSERPNEIWMLSLSDDSYQRVFRQPSWTISEPHLTPDGQYIAFLATNVKLCQKYYGCYRDTSGPVVFLLDLRTHHVTRFLSGSDVPLTDFIDVSPSGQVAYTDLGSALTLALPSGQGLVHIPNRGNSLEFAGFDAAGDKAAFVGQTPYSTGGDVLVYVKGSYTDVSRGVYDSSTPAFSTSGKRIAYAGYAGELGIEPIYGIYVYDFATGRTRHLTHQTRLSDWAPQWSLDDRYIAFVRSAPQESMYMGSGQLWVMRSDGRAAHPLGVAGTNVQWVD